MRFITYLAKNVRDEVNSICKNETNDCILTIYIELFICFVVYPILFTACIYALKKQQYVYILFMFAIFVFFTADSK